MKVYSNNTALIKTKFGKHQTLYNFIMLKHYNENEIKKWQRHQKKQKKTLLENTTRTYSKRTVELRTDGGPMTRAKAKEIEKQKSAKIQYSEAVKNSCPNTITLNSAQILKYGA
jgi:hypothetical protein